MTRAQAREVAQQIADKTQQPAAVLRLWGHIYGVRKGYRVAPADLVVEILEPTAIRGII